MVFFGEYTVSFASSGRLVLPKKIRELLKGNIFVLTKGYDSSLAGYDKDDWEKKAGEILQTSSLLEKDNLEKRRFIFSSAVYLEIDEQGRFVIPRTLLSHAGITEKAVIVGVGDHFEIWEQDKWNKYVKETRN